METKDKDKLPPKYHFVFWLCIVLYFVLLIEMLTFQKYSDPCLYQYFLEILTYFWKIFYFLKYTYSNSYKRCIQFINNNTFKDKRKCASFEFSRNFSESWNFLKLSFLNINEGFKHQWRNFQWRKIKRKR